MKLSLVVLTAGTSKGKIIPIPRSPFVIGRDAKCHLRPASAMVSNRHCTLEIREGKVYVTDLGSTNGTFINEDRLEKDAARELRNTDRLMIGPLAFESRIESSASVDQRTPLPSTKAPSTKPGDDDAVAALLLSMQDGDPPSGATTLDSQGVPTGGTEVGSAGVEPPSDMTQTAIVGEGEDTKNDDGKKGQAKAQANSNKTTAAVAEELLKKYLRRPRKA
jgi:pSer/pThr/pTyr-binding forkhead associated (FHA) protein